MSVPSISEIVSRFIVKAVSGPEWLLRASAIASLSVCEHALSLVFQGIAADIRGLKDNLQKRDSAERDEVVAMAAAKSNVKTLKQRNEQIHALEVERQGVANAKTQAEAEAIKMDAESRRQLATAEAMQKVIQAITQLRQAGGEVLFDPAELKELLSLRPNLEAPQPDEPPRVI